MGDSDGWAFGVMAVSAMSRGHIIGTTACDDARTLAERLTGNVMLHSPTETFSQLMPTYSPPPEDEGLAPIDIVYGHYSPESRLIEIFVNRIRHGAQQFGWEFADLLEIVRIHEYAHAIVHIGIDIRSVEHQLNTFLPGQNTSTDWESFTKERDKAFSTVDDESHELLAQAITLGCLSQQSDQFDSQRLIDTFLALAERQPRKYRLPPEVTLHTARHADWGVVLWAARGEIDCCRGSSFKLTDGLASLIRETAELPGSTEASANSALTLFVDELQRRLANVDPAMKKSNSGNMELLFLKKGLLEVRMYQERAHKRPHFHIEYKRQYRASYALDTCEIIIGHMPKKYEAEILPLAAAMKDQLIEAWHALNGSVRITRSADC
jgi:hypothetical protein